MKVIKCWRILCYSLRKLIYSLLLYEYLLIPNKADSTNWINDGEVWNERWSEQLISSSQFKWIS